MFYHHSVFICILKYLLGDIFVYTLPVINYEEGISISRGFDVEQFREFSLELQREISEERRLMISQELSNFYGDYPT